LNSFKHQSEPFNDVGLPVSLAHFMQPERHALGSENRADVINDIHKHQAFFMLSQGSPNHIRAKRSDGHSS
jgi:hypothetical protein